MNYEKLDACEKICMLFWKEHNDDTEYMHCCRSRYLKVINKDGVSVTTKVAVRQLRYIPITPRLKWLFLCKETAQQMRWHKEGIRDSEDADIMPHPTDAEAWYALDYIYKLGHAGQARPEPMSGLGHLNRAAARLD
jgi:hypothetical protein